MEKTQKTQLLKWFEENQRPLPWRESKDPYRVWISESMLQQTTTTAVIPYFKRFIKSFPTLKSLAKAPESKVIENWAGLGYYSRAKNLHKAAKLLSKMPQFPQTHTDLVKLPGFGPYTSRAVSSIAFGESTGVLDGNVIRVLSRKNNLKTKWWTTSGRNELQSLADKAVEKVDAANMNQALMELGATICLPKNPQCLLCPWLKSCKSLKAKTQLDLPLKKPKREKEYWHWTAEVHVNSGHIKLIKNEYAPFLRKQWFLPGSAKKLSQKPKQYDLRHSITHHDIYISVKKVKSRLKTRANSTDTVWVMPKDVVQYSPTSLLQKVLQPGS